MADDTPIHPEETPTNDISAQEPPAPAETTARRQPAHLSASFDTLYLAEALANAEDTSDAETSARASANAEAGASASEDSPVTTGAAEPAQDAQPPEADQGTARPDEGGPCTDDDPAGVTESRPTDEPATEELPLPQAGVDDPTARLDDSVGADDTAPHEPTVESSPVALSRGRRLPRMLRGLWERVFPARDSHARVMAACVLLIALGVIAAAALALMPKTHQPVPVLISVSAPNLGADGSPVPVHVTGADIDGAVVDRTEYLVPGNHQLELVPGGYTVTVLASPLVPSGTLYVTDGIAARLDVSEFEFDDGHGHGSASLTLGIAGVEQMTDEAIESARTYALSSGMGEGGVQRLVDATVAHRTALLPATYSYEYASADSLHKGKLSGTPATDDGISSWYAYPVFTSTKDNEDMDKLNKELRSAAEAAATGKASSGLFDSAGNALYHAQVTYFAGGVAGLRIESWSTNKGGDTKVEARVVDLDTGEEQDPWEFVGLKRSELNACAADALELFLKSLEPTTASSAQTPADEDDWIAQTNRWMEDLFGDKRTMRERASDLVKNGKLTYYLTADGIVASFATKDLGLSDKAAKANPAVRSDLLVCDLAGEPCATGSRYEQVNPPATTMTGKQP